MSTLSRDTHVLWEPSTASSLPADPPVARPSQSPVAGSPGTPDEPATGSPDRPPHTRWERPALAGLLLMTAALYLWDLSASGWAN